MTTTIKYRAFLSYSHRDTSWGKWLHEALEGYRIDRDLVGRVTPVGPVPKTLRPIFRDREDFSAGHSLTAQTLDAMEASQFLIVLCSPNAAQSKYVNEEVRRFKMLGRADRLIPVIVDGEPGNPNRECFPSTLKFKLGADGSVTETEEEPIAADARSHGDGKEIAKQKVVAGLLGVSLDGIVRRAEVARKRRNRAWAALAGVFLLLAVAAIGSASYAYQKLLESEDRLDQAVEIAYGFVAEATAMSDRFGVPTDMNLALLRRPEGALNKLISRGASSKSLQYRKALMLISFSDSYDKLGETDEALHRAIEGQKLLHELIEKNPLSVDWQLSFLRSEVQTGALLTNERKFPAAISAYREGLVAGERLLQQAPGAEVVSILARVYINIGDVNLTLGLLPEARENYVLALNSVTQFSNGHGGTDLFDLKSAIVKQPLLGYITTQATDRLSNVQMLQGNFSNALQYREGMLRYRQSVADANPQSILAQWGLLDSKVQVANSLLDAGSIDEATAGFHDALLVGESLSTSDPKNIIYRRLVAIAKDGAGRTLLAKGQGAEALAIFQENLKRAKPFIESDAGNLAWKVNLAIGYERIGDALMSLGDFAEATKQFVVERSIVSKLSSGGAQDPELQTRLAISHFKIGEALLSQGMTEEAEKSFNESLLIWKNGLSANLGYRDFIVYQIYPLKARWRIAQIQDDQAELQKSRHQLERLRGLKALDEESRRWFAKAESELAQSGMNGSPLALIDCESGNRDTAIATCSEAIAVAGENPTNLSMAYKLRGDAYSAKGQFDSAILDYSQALRLKLNYPSALNGRGLAFYNKGKFDEAIEDFDAALVFEAGSAVIYSNRALAHDGKGQADQALSDYNASISLDANNAVTRMNRGIHFSQQRLFDGAIEDFTEAIRLKPSVTGYMNRAAAYSEQGKFDQAISDLSAAIGIDPRSLAAFNSRGVAHLRKGDNNQALADFTEAIRLDPYDPIGHTNRGRVYEIQGQFDKALSEHNTAILLKPRFALAYANRGLAYEAKGDRNHALSDFEAALAIDPTIKRAIDGRERIQASRLRSQ